MTIAKRPRAFQNAFQNKRLKIYRRHPKLPTAAPATEQERQRRNNLLARRVHARPGVVALREIEYYQNATLAEGSFIPRSRFTCLIKELIQNNMGLARNNALVPGGLAAPPYRIQRDALIALQIATEHNLFAIHAKRVTVKPVDMQLLRDLWKRISPDSAIGADNQDTIRARQVADKIQRDQALKAVSGLKTKIVRLRREGRLHTLTVGERNLGCAHNLRIDG